MVNPVGEQLMKSAKASIKRTAGRAYNWIDRRVSDLRANNHLVREDFDNGGETLCAYLSTHRNRYHRHVGAHFLLELHKAGPDVLSGFADKHRLYGWHFELTQQEKGALKAARDITCTHSRIANLRYTTNVFEQVTNRRQLTRMIGLGAVAGSAALLLGLSELFFFAKEAARNTMQNWFGTSWMDGPGTNDAFVSLANDITQGAADADGKLDPELVGERIANLVASLETAQDADAMVKYLNADTSYIIGILSGIVIIIIGRGLVQIIVEGLTGAVSKIDALVEDMDEFCEWKLGRSPFPPAAKTLPGDLIIHEPGKLILTPQNIAQDFPSEAGRPHFPFTEMK